jgi:glycosyltransferase involved in cell wall biosynthesis
MGEFYYRRMKRKLIFLVTEDWYFHMHRLPQARAARDAGFEVVVACRVRDHGAAIEAEGFTLRPLAWKRRSTNPFAALVAIARIASLYRMEQPDIVHHVSLKPILLGTIAARIAGVRVIVDAFTGLGKLFLDPSIGVRGLRMAILPMLRLALATRSVHLIAENSEHLETLARLGIARKGQSTLIRGSGVDVDRFSPSPEPTGPIVVACAARMLRSKGILVLAEAMKRLQGRADIRLSLAGVPDPESIDTLTDGDMNAISELPNVGWRGRVSDMPGFWRDCHIAVLPSITGEGLPVSLLEAAACARPLVATDVSGCRDVVVPDSTGILAPAGDAQALADAIVRLADDPAMRARYGAAACALVSGEFSAFEIGRRTVGLYEDLLTTNHA